MLEVRKVRPPPGDTRVPGSSTDEVGGSPGSPSSVRPGRWSVTIVVMSVATFSPMRPRIVSPTTCSKNALRFVEKVAAASAWCSARSIADFAAASVCRLLATAASPAWSLLLAAVNPATAAVSWSTTWRPRFAKRAADSRVSRTTCACAFASENSGARASAWATTRRSAVTREVLDGGRRRRLERADTLLEHLQSGVLHVLDREHHAVGHVVVQRVVAAGHLVDALLDEQPDVPGLVGGGPSVRAARVDGRELDPDDPGRSGELVVVQRHGSAPVVRGRP